MEDKIKKAFASLSMPDSCDEVIRKSMGRKKRIHWKPLAIAASLVAVILILAQPQTVQAIETAVVKAQTAITSLMGQHRSHVEEEFPGAVPDEIIVLDNGNIIEESGTTANGTKYHSTTWSTAVPSWLDLREDGVYFTGDGQELEISDLMDEENPFTYIFTDVKGIRHYIAVAGTYDPEDLLTKRLGWTEYFQEAPYGIDDWISGYAKGHCDQDGNTYQWVRNAKELLGHPFPIH